MRWRNAIRFLLVATVLVGSVACANWSRYTPAGVDDDVMEAEIRKNMVDDGITGLSIKINEGVVTLEGNVSSRDDERKAIDAARKVKGVRRVVDRISVTS
jgi:osmotically-inducible protein OsmY